MSRAPQHAPPSRTRRFFRNGTRILSWVYLFVILQILILVLGVSERWWLGTVLTYLPRAPYLLPGLLLVPVALFTDRWSLVPLLAGLALTAGPLMGLRTNFGSSSAEAGDGVLRVVSCNIHDGKPSLESSLSEIHAAKPDLVLLQEAYEIDSELSRSFEGWNILEKGEFWVASKYPIQVVDDFTPKVTKRRSAFAVEVTTPAGKVVAVNLHLEPARHGLLKVKIASLLTGAGVEELEDHQQTREQEAMETRAFVQQVIQNQPAIVAGDFNTPSTSSLFGLWSDFVCVFDSAGRGYGYTAPCGTDRLWPKNTPWLRIDHLLVSEQLIPVSSSIGTAGGSDHRVTNAVLRYNMVSKK